MAKRSKVRTAGSAEVRKVERKFVLSPDASKRLDIHAVGEGVTASALVERLILDHCRRWVLQDRERERGEKPAPPPVRLATNGGEDADADAA